MSRLVDAARYLADRDFAQAKRFARLATDQRDPADRAFWRQCAADILNVARRNLGYSRGDA